MIRCPDCNRYNESTKKHGQVQCRKCLQYIIIKDGKAIKAIPKDLI
jgi:DNA-directed RNA polymerase subunit RPC12/RpoP